MTNKRQFVPPGDGPLFPGPKYKPNKGATLNPKLLEREVLRLAAELGPDHPKVKLLKKELALRQSQRP